MKKFIGLLIALTIIAVSSCYQQTKDEELSLDNPKVLLSIPKDFPALNESVSSNPPTLYGVALGKKLFNEKKLSGNNTISCSSCHQPNKAFSDGHSRAIGIFDRVGLRNTPPIQNLAFMKQYNWDGNKRELEKQPLVPIITHEEMNSSILDVIHKISNDQEYKLLFYRAFGDPQITPDRIFRSIAQYEYTLISANSKYDKVKRKEAVYFSDAENRGYQLFQSKCATCHSGELFTDQSFRNMGFPVNPNSEEAGRARVTGRAEDYMQFRVPTLRNIAYTAPYGSFGQFKTLQEVLDYLDKGVLISENLDPLLTKKSNRIPMTAEQKTDIIAFLYTLSDEDFLMDK